MKNKTNTYINFAVHLAGLIMSAHAATACAADAYPVKPVRWIAPVLAGGGGDLIARAVAPKLSEAWGQQVIIDNRVGGGGTLGMTIAMKMPADGYTMVLGVMSFVGVAPALYPKLAYDPRRDFVAVTQILDAPLILAAHPSLPAKNVRELIALAKAKPGSISYASPGSGTAAHMATELIRSMSGTQMLHVPYRGAPPALTDVVSGQVTMYMTTVPGGMALIKSGRLKVLGSSSLKRTRALPDVPTIAESGLPGYDVTTWYGVLAPVGLPAPILTRMNTDIVRAIRLPDVQERFASEGGDIVGNSSEEFGAFIAREIAKWTKVAKDAGVKPD
mgnify:CR=1 FL=1